MWSLLREILKRGSVHASPRDIFHHFRETPGFMATPVVRASLSGRDLPSVTGYHNISLAVDQEA
jgi:hypothetical protein